MSMPIIIGSVGNQKSKLKPGIIRNNGTERGTRNTRIRKICLTENNTRKRTTRTMGSTLNKNSSHTVKNAFARMNNVEIPIIPISYFCLNNRLFFSLWHNKIGDYN